MIRKTMSILLVGLAFAGCGGDDDGDSEDGAASTATKQAPARSDDDRGTEPVGSADVTLSEFEVALAKKGFSQEGVYTLAVRNNGKMTHALEAKGPNGESETEEIPPGGSTELDAYFVGGTYELYCPIGDHRGRGMTAKLRVKR